VDFFMNVFGDMSAICWSIDYEGQATLASAQKQALEDPKFFEMLERGKGYVERGSVYDTVMRMI
jgi:hypothetical protein